MDIKDAEGASVRDYAEIKKNQFMVALFDRFRLSRLSKINEIAKENNHELLF